MQAKQQTPEGEFPWLSEDQLGDMFTLAAEQFKSQSYDVNRVAREVLERINLSRKDTPVRQDGQSELSKQVLQGCALIGNTPGYLVELLNEEVLVSHSHTVTLNSHNRMVAERWMADFTDKVGRLRMPDYLRTKKFRECMFGFLNEVARRVSKLYEASAAQLKSMMQEISTKTKKSKLMNNYVLYKLFREVSQLGKTHYIQDATEGVFRHCSQDTVQAFFKYLLNKFEVVKLFANAEIHDEMYQPTMVSFIKRLEDNKVIELESREAFNLDGRFGIYVKTFSEKNEVQKDLSDYMVVYEEEKKLVQVANCQTLRKKWFVSEPIKSNSRLSSIVTDYLCEGQQRITYLKHSNKGKPLQSLLSCAPLEAYTNVNGVLGRSLYLIKRYNGADDFFTDISKRAILTRSVEELIAHIPVVAYMIAVGSFSAAFYNIYSNKFATQGKKLKQLGGFMIHSGTAMGSSILGAFAGQLLIPVPVIGALVGTVIGGYLGEKGGKMINSWIEKRHFRHIINYLRRQQIDRCYWQDRQGFFETLELKEEEFNQYTPPYLSGTTFATLVAFVLVCFHEYKRLVDYNEENVKKIGKVEKRAQSQWDEEARRMGHGDFQTEFDIKRIAEYLQERNGYLFEHYDTLEKSMLGFLSKIIT